VNEVILEGSPLQISKILVNFDVHNNTEYDVTNFELEFLGLDFTCSDIDWALGFVLDPTNPGPIERWGAHGNSPLIVRPITLTMADGTERNATEVKWVEACRPLENCEWVHLGLEFNINLPIEDLQNNPITVQGYWTIIPKVWCEEAVNPHGKNVPPAGWSTMPGPKGGQNDEGFYQLFAEDPCAEPGAPPLEIFIGYEDDAGNIFYVAPGDPTSGISGYSSGTVVKVTEAKGSKGGSVKKIGSIKSKGNASAVTDHITLPSDPVIYLGYYDAVTGQFIVIEKCYKCLVPPPPK
jgi:hypothetical protein